MEILKIFRDVLIGMLQILIQAAVGVLLAKLSPMDPVGEKKFNMSVFYVFLPLYCFLEISNAIDLTEKILPIGLLIFSFTIATIVSVLLGVAYGKLARVDIRVMKSFLIVCAFGSVTAFPIIMASALCDTGGILSSDENCAYYQGYSLIGLLMLNIYLWASAPLMISRDKVECYNTRRKMYLVRMFYNSLDEFMKDKTLAKMDQAQQEKQGGDVLKTIESDRELTVKDFFDHVPDEHPHETLEDEGLIEFSLGMNLSPSNCQNFTKHFEFLLQKIPPSIFENIKQTLPRTIKPVPITFKYITSQLISPPLFACLLGLIIGMISPIRNSMFSSWGMKLFFKTLIKLGTFAVPILVMLLGAKLSHGFAITKTVNLRMVDLVSVIIIRLVVVPAIGLAFIAFLHAISGSAKDDNVLFFLVYSFWNVPPSILMISAFVMVGYYSKEIAILQFWTNTLSAISMPLFYVAYFSLYPVS